MRKHIPQAAFMAVLAGALLLVSRAPVSASVPSSGATIQDRAQPQDRSGRLFQEAQFVGWKVFVATSPSQTPLLDEAGNTVTSGMVHQVCLSSGAAATDFAIVYDSAPVAGGLVTSALQPTNVPYQLTPVINRATALEHCLIIDAQFNYGAIVLQGASPTNGTTHVYWRPSRGGTN